VEIIALEPPVNGAVTTVRAVRRKARTTILSDLRQVPRLP